MSFNHLQGKFAYLHKNLPVHTMKILGAQLEKHFQNLVAQDQFHKVTFIVTEILYAINRHQPWRENEYFQGLLASYIGGQYELSYNRIYEIIQDICKSLGRLTQIPSSEDSYDLREFIKYLIVSVSEARDEKTLISDLGLGIEVINHIKHFLLSENSPHGNQPYRFENGYQKAFYSALEDLSKEFRQRNWSLDLFKLKLQMNGSEKLNASTRNYEILNSILDLLLIVGENKMISEKHLHEFINEEFKVTFGNDTKINAEDFLGELASCGLLFVSDKIGKKSIYSLTAKSQALTAKMYATWNQKKILDDITLLPKLNAYYQNAFFRELNDNDWKYAYTKIVQKKLLRELEDLSLLTFVERCVRDYRRQNQVGLDGTSATLESFRKTEIESNTENIIQDLQTALSEALESTPYARHRVRFVRALLLLPRRREILKYLCTYLIRNEGARFNQEILLQLLKLGIDFDLGDYLEEVLTQPRNATNSSAQTPMKKSLEYDNATKSVNK